MKSEKLTQGGIVPVPHSWHAAFVSALSESDPIKLTGRIEYAISAIERRYSEWETRPGTSAELTAIGKCMGILERLLRQTQPECTRISEQPLDASSYLEANRFY